MAAAKLSTKDISRIAMAAQSNARQAFLARRMPTQAAPGCAPCRSKDYSASCPDTWVVRDGACVASPEYAGPCAEQQIFLASSAAEKEESEKLCSFCWPCLDDAGPHGQAACQRHWSQACPQSYVAPDIPYDEFDRSSGKICVAAFGSPCESMVTFEGAADKHLFSNRCGVQWPCVNDCDGIGASEPCPVDWTHIGDGLCVAGANYKTIGCPPVGTYRGWSRAMRLEYAEQCGIVWPCPGSTSVQNGPSSGMTCDSADLGNDVCPIGWASQADGFCEPPMSLSGECALPLRVGDMSTAEKLAWASKCMQSWPCLGLASVHIPKKTSGDVVCDVVRER